MADHYEKATELLTTVEFIKADLTKQFQAEERDPKEIARLSTRLHRTVDEAQTHALLAIAQRIDDLAVRR